MEPKTKYRKASVVSHERDQGDAGFGGKIYTIFWVFLSIEHSHFHTSQCRLCGKHPQSPERE